mmetsp:Transcript_66105/g.158143  ORF Transcript_66105/g.158143 Transcript_66105/m.158143 type:complete len:610 (+) Transcript_66105:172-2001(+)|eukprot:CAMPEP_0178456894 /NCGR_PEP_ID=MMETSP0689_2-20121128/46728_1 /TAXON_ID=160604 /ORGANISM="Amphidinium massartii, Strain CS-259" /LENGTH=609 /DNA_ID=CAMNT_0020083111 /DNA_START=100 /DNA_END=1929 /DNA_ORIENTATION=-
MSFLPAPISWVGKHTEKEVIKLRAQAKVKYAPKDDGYGTAVAADIGKSKTMSRDAAASDGALARDVQEFLKQKQSSAQANEGMRGTDTMGGSRPGSRADSRPPSSPTSPMKLSAVFMSPYFVDHVWHGANRNLTRGIGVAQTTQNMSSPGPGRYKPTFDQVLDRSPAWDFSAKERSTSRANSPSRGSDEGGDLFLTSVDVKDLDPSTMSPRQRSALRASMSADQLAALGLTADDDHAKRSRRGPMALSPGRKSQSGRARTPPVGDNPHEAIEDYLQQDIVAFHRPRTPDVDFDKNLGRDVEMPKIAAPGDYDPDWKLVAPSVKTGIPFERALPREVEKASGPPRMHMPLSPLYKDHDAIRRRITHVNDFSKELPRPSLNPIKVYHNESDPEACASVYNFEMNFDINEAEKAIMHRHTQAPDIKRCLPRSRHAVQGVRILLKDLGVRGAFGLALHENKALSSVSVDRREGRKAAGRVRPDIGPKLVNYTSHPAAHVGGVNPNRGHLVKPTSLHSKQAPRLTTRMASFQREAAQQGFEKGMRLASGRPEAGSLQRARSESPTGSPRRQPQNLPRSTSSAAVMSPLRAAAAADMKRQRRYEALCLAEAGVLD